MMMKSWPCWRRGTSSRWPGILSLASCFLCPPLWYVSALDSISICSEFTLMYTVYTGCIATGDFAGLTIRRNLVTAGSAAIPWWFKETPLLRYSQQPMFELSSRKKRYLGFRKLTKHQENSSNYAETMLANIHKIFTSYYAVYKLIQP